METKTTESYIEQMVAREKAREAKEANLSNFNKVLEARAKDNDTVKFVKEKYLDKYREKHQAFIEKESDANVVVDNMLSVSEAWAELDDLKAKSQTQETTTETEQETPKAEIEVDKVLTSGGDTKDSSVTASEVKGAVDFQNVNLDEVPEHKQEYYKSRKRKGLSKPVDCSNMNWSTAGH